MNVKSTLKLAASGAALFGLGALVTAVVIGRVPADLGLSTLSARGQIEQIVHEYLMTHPEIIIEMSNRLDNQQAASEDKARTDALFQLGTKALVDPKIAYVEGPADAKITLVEFFDYRCPHCKASLNAVRKVVAENPNVRVAFIERPILTPDSVIAAHAAVAARKQPGKYVPFHLALMATAGELPKDRILDIAKTVGLDTVKLSKDMEDPAVIEQVKQSNALADQLHFNGTPTFVINDKIIVGELTTDELQTLIKDPKG